MLVRLYRWFAKRSGRKAVVLFVVAMVMMNLLLLWQLQSITGHTGGKALILDTEMGYTAEQVYTWFELYGEAGRQSYFWMAVLTDVVYPIIYTLALIFFYVTLLESFMPRYVNTLYKYCFWPVLIFVVDMVENSCTAVLLSAYPAQMPNLVAWASAITQAKWLLVLVALTVLVMGLVGYLIYKEEVKQQRHRYCELDEHEHDHKH